MKDIGKRYSEFGLENAGLKTTGRRFWNLGTAALVEEALRRGEGSLASSGALVCRTGARTGRSPNDKFVVREPSSEGKVWWGKVNRPIDADVFDRVHKQLAAHLQDKDLFVQDLWAGADPKYRLPIRVVSEDAWHSLFVRQLFIRDNAEDFARIKPRFTIINGWKYKAGGKADGLNSECFVLLNLAKGLIIIGGTGYAGEMKKSIFSVLNYLLPQEGVLSMHCSANVGKDGDVALFFGLSGTGKTTLSADPNRGLIGDDEHGWSDDGVFNFEGGCYAKCIRLSPKDEPEIYGAIRFGSVVENVVMDPETRVVNFDADDVTENTRVAYPLDFISNAVLPSRAGHPKNVVFLTADAFGVLPPISKLTPAQAMYHYLSGYTAKVAGTEAGVKDPEATFSACFGAPFLPLHPTTYAELLGEKLAKHGAACWLVNTGWSGGPYGVGKRMKIPHTRAMLTAALDGRLAKAEFEVDPVFGLHVPTACPDVPTEVLKPRNTWRDKDAYDAKATDLAKRFHKNFEQFEKASDEIRSAGPLAGR